MKRYKHLLPVDIPVWERFLNSSSWNPLAIEYDVRVGLGSQPLPELPATIRQMWTDLTQKRIDAVYRQPHLITVVEITRLAGMKAIGQLTTYPILYQKTFFPFLPIRALLVCEELLPDIQVVLDERAIDYNILPDPDKKYRQVDEL